MVESLIELPLDTLVEILLKLPIKALGACRCACKTLQELTTSNPYFTALYSPKETLIQFGCVRKSLHNIHLLDVEADTKSRVSSPILTISRSQVYSYKKRSRDEKEVLFEIALVNACNQLVYFVAEPVDRCFSLLCNPITNEYVKVPKIPDPWNIRRTLSLNLGFCPRTRRYKVLGVCRVINRRCRRSEVEAQIHDVGSSTNAWRKIEAKPSDMIHWNDSCAFLNGVTYWLCRAYRANWKSRNIVRFDFEKEIFGEVEPPPNINAYKQWFRHWMSIGVLEDRLCFVDNSRNFDIWVTSTSSDPESYCWIKQFSVAEPIVENRDITRCTLRLLQVLRNGEMLMIWDGCNLVRFDPRKSSFRLVNLPEVKQHFTAITFAPS